MTEERVTWGHTNDEGRCTADIAMDLHTILRTSGKGYYIALSGVRMEVFPRTRCPVGVCARSHLLLQYHLLAYLRPSSQHSRPLGMPEWRELSGTLTLVMKVTVSRMRCSASAAVEWTQRVGVLGKEVKQTAYACTMHECCSVDTCLLHLSPD